MQSSSAQETQHLKFDNRFTRDLSVDPETENHPRQVFGSCFSRVMPVHSSQPKLVIYDKGVADLLGLSSDFCESADFSAIFSGNQILAGMDPHASCYGGHQFGNWAGQLGDGRAINLGETVNNNDEHWMLQLKGSGSTPYSRNADGLAVMRSSVREFLCSEAMHHLGVPTTRALSLVASGDSVMRDMFYDGNPKAEPGAIVCRVAPSFIRFGSMQIFSSRNDIATLTALLDHTIINHFSHLGKPSKACYLQWFEEVCHSTAELMVHWMRVGFVHGVMNTDNMSVHGLTLDYGPYGWLEPFDPEWTPNTTDRELRRYRFGNQPAIAGWNLARLGEAILPLIDDVGPLQAALDHYTANYDSMWLKMMHDKLGLCSATPEKNRALIDELQEILTLIETDMTIFFRKLADIDASIDPDKPSNMQLIQPLIDAYYAPEEISGSIAEKIAGWLRRYVFCLQLETRSHPERKTAMNRCNPKYVLRNYLSQQASDLAETGDYSEIKRLHQLLQNPYDEQPEFERYAERRPEWARSRPGCSMLSCSS